MLLSATASQQTVKQQQLLQSLVRFLCDGRELVAQGDDKLGHVGHDHVEARGEGGLLAWLG